MGVGFVGLSVVSIFIILSYLEVESNSWSRCSLWDWYGRAWLRGLEYILGLVSADAARGKTSPVIVSKLKNNVKVRKSAEHPVWTMNMIGWCASILIVISLLLAISIYIMNEMSKVVGPWGFYTDLTWTVNYLFSLFPNDSFNKFFNQIETEGELYIRIVSPFTHSVVFAAICGLALGLAHRITIVKQSLPFLENE